MSNYAISQKELQSLVDRSVRRTLEELGHIPKLIPRKEMVARIGRGNYDRGVTLGILKPIKKGGSTSTIYCLRQEFEDYELQVLL